MLRVVGGDLHTLGFWELWGCGGSLLSPQLCKDHWHWEEAEGTADTAPSPAWRCSGKGASAPTTTGRAHEVKGQVSAESWPQGYPELVLADPLSARGISSTGLSKGHLGQGEGWLVPSVPSHCQPPNLHLTPHVFVRGFVSVPF